MQIEGKGRGRLSLQELLYSNNMQGKTIWQREPQGHDEHKDEVVGEEERMFQTVGRHLPFAAAGSGQTGPDEDPSQLSVSTSKQLSSCSGIEDRNLRTGKKWNEIVQKSSEKIVCEDERNGAETRRECTIQGDIFLFLFSLSIRV